MNKLEVGMYVRITTLSGIGKIAKLEKIDDICITDNGAVDKNNIIKVSHNIIDLIEVGDYVNGNKVTETMIKMRDEQGIFGLPDVCNMYIEEIKIKSILTKEQFSSMEYKVEG